MSRDRYTRAPVWACGISCAPLGPWWRHTCGPHFLRWYGIPCPASPRATSAVAVHPHRQTAFAPPHPLGGPRVRALTAAAAHSSRARRTDPASRSQTTRARAHGSQRARCPAAAVVSGRSGGAARACAAGASRVLQRAPTAQRRHVRRVALGGRRVDHRRTRGASVSSAQVSVRVARAPAATAHHTSAYPHNVVPPRPRTSKTPASEVSHARQPADPHRAPPLPLTACANAPARRVPAATTETSSVSTVASVASSTAASTSSPTTRGCSRAT